MSLQPFEPKKVRMVVFDFDGVLVESSEIKTMAFEALFSDHPQHVDRIREHHLANEGISRFQKFQWIYDELLKRPLTHAESELLGSRFSELVGEGVLSAPMVPGASESLRVLKARRLPAAVASGTPQCELKNIIKLRGLNDFIEEAQGAPKTKPWILTDLAKRWQLQPSQLLMVGDAASDFQAAKEAGTQFFGRERQGSPTPWRGTNSYFGNDLRELPDLLRGINRNDQRPARL
jgi:phosphoglycolate phosphatase-like HAD superfamily hydrolase